MRCPVQALMKALLTKPGNDSPLRKNLPPPSTGVLFAPGGDQEAVKLNVPLSTTLGIRGKGFNVGVNYTPMFDLLNGGKYGHIVGLNLQFDVK